MTSEKEMLVRLDALNSIKRKYLTLADIVGNPVGPYPKTTPQDVCERISNIVANPWDFIQFLLETREQ